MVGYNPGNAVQLTLYQLAAAGAISGSISRVIGQPLDVLKIRFQLQVEPVKKGFGKYHGLLHGARTILHEEGLFSLWKGHVPGQCLSIVYGIVAFSMFEFLTKSVWTCLPVQLTTSYRPAIHTACGSMSAIAAMACVQPFDVLRTRLVAQAEPKMYRGISHACQMIWKVEGLTAFYKGLIPALVQVAPQSGLQFGFYALFTGFWERLNSKQKVRTIPGPVESAVCGSAAGICGKILLYPLEICKKRLEIQGFDRSRYKFGASKHYNGLVDCIQTILREEGLKGMYKGLNPTLLKAAVTTGIHFSVYDQICHMIVSHRQR